jgi:hypothetical protein
VAALLAALDWQNYEAYLPYGVGVGVMLVVAVVWRMIAGRRRGLLAPPAKRKSWGVDDGVEDDTFANRRSANRRDGKPVRVLMSSPTFRGELESGWVLDRSTGGLRIAVAGPIPVGATIQVRTENAPDTIPWVTVVVRSCKPDQKHHELGCSFESTPPWNVLLLFG